jgi:hypothetical protein
MADTATSAREVGYAPRKAFLPFHERQARWSIIVAHRRAGKTMACVMDLLTGALSTAKQEARYGFVAPFREQAKMVAWNYLQRFASPVVRSVEDDLRQSELAVRLPNGAQVRLYGADNPNALRGIYLDGVVMDEYADMRPSLWGEVIRPSLSDRKGWAVFIGTPRGTNEFRRLWDDSASDPGWYRLMLKASESGILPPEELTDARRQMTEAQYQQEYECSFEAAILGAIYAKELEASAARITSVPYDAAQLVQVAWDIGIGDATALWCWQQVGQEVRVIDYYESSGERIPHYLSWLQSRGYHYDRQWLPHDAENRQLTGLSVAEVVGQAGFGARVLPRLPLEDGINAVRMLFPRLWFDRERCKAGLEALRHYRWGYNERMGELKPAPVHDWSSHAADSIRYLAQAARSAESGSRLQKLPPLKYGWRASPT